MFFIHVGGFTFVGIFTFDGLTHVSHLRGRSLNQCATNLGICPYMLAYRPAMQLLAYNTKHRFIVYTKL